MPAVTADGLDWAVATKCHVTPANEPAPLELFLSSWKELSHDFERLRVFIIVALEFIMPDQWPRRQVLHNRPET